MLLSLFSLDILRGALRFEKIKHGSVAKVFLIKLLNKKTKSLGYEKRTSKSKTRLRKTTWNKKAGKLVNVALNYAKILLNQYATRPEDPSTDQNSVSTAVITKSDTQQTGQFIDWIRGDKSKKE